MKYLDWLKTNPEKGYYWVKYQDCDEERIDEFTDWYDNAGNKETRFTDQPDEVISDRLTYDDWQQLENWARFTDDYHALKEKLEIAEYENAELREELKEKDTKFFAESIYPPHLTNGDFPVKYDIDKLKNLLKECQKSISWYQETYGAMDLETYTLLAKLNEFLK